MSRLGHMGRDNEDRVTSRTFFCALVISAGEAHSLKIDEILFEGKSDFQDVAIFKVTSVRHAR